MVAVAAAAVTEHKKNQIDCMYENVRWKCKVLFPLVKTNTPLAASGTSHTHTDRDINAEFDIFILCMTDKFRNSKL